jgi:hypothetical protein
MSKMSAEEREAELVDAYDRIAQLEIENQRLRQAMLDGNRLHSWEAPMCDSGLS